MSTYPVEIDLTGGSTPVLRLWVVLAALVGGVVLLLGLALAANTVTYVSDHMDAGQTLVRGGGTTGDRIAQLDAAVSDR